MANSVEQIPCLKCNKLFYTKDRKRNRICIKCNQKNNETQQITTKVSTCYPFTVYKLIKHSHG